MERKKHNIIATLGLVFVFIMVASAITISYFNFYENRPLVLLIGVFFLTLFIIYVSRSWETIDLGEIGIVTLFGKPQFITGGGFVWTLWPFYNLKKEKQKLSEVSFVRLNIAHGKEEDATKRFSTFVSLSVRYEITDGNIYFEKIKGEEGLRKLIYPTLHSELAIIFSKKKYSDNLDKREEINRLLEGKMKEDTAGFGVNIHNVVLLDIELDMKTSLIHASLSNPNFKQLDQPEN